MDHSLHRALQAVEQTVQSGTDVGAWVWVWGTARTVCVEWVGGGVTEVVGGQIMQGPVGRRKNADFDIEGDIEEFLPPSLGDSEQKYAMS